MDDAKATDHRKWPASVESDWRSRFARLQAGAGNEQRTRRLRRALQRTAAPQPQQLRNAGDQVILVKMLSPGRDWHSQFQSNSSSTDSDAKARNSSELTRGISSTRRLGDEAPLIHTDKLNASSPTIYVYGPKRVAGGSNATRTSLTEHLQAAESSPRAQAVLAATSPVQMDAERAQLVPRLVVLNLEVTNSSATLTWTLGLYPGGDAVGSSRVPTATTTTSESDLRNKEEPQQQRLQADKASSASASQQVQDGLLLRSSQIVKRDTIRVWPTLNWRNDADSSTSASSATTTDGDHDDAESLAHNGAGGSRSSRVEVSKAAPGEEAETDAESRKRKAGEEESERRGRQPEPLSVKSEQDAADGGDLLRTNTTDQLGWPLASSQLAEQQVQLSRLQPLSATTNRRPPMRQLDGSSTTATPDETSEIISTFIERLSAESSPAPPPTVRPRPIVSVLGSRRKQPRPAAGATPTSAQVPGLARARVQVASSEEPPMIRLPVVPLNRLSTAAPSTSSTSSTTSTSTSTTTSTTTTEPPATTTVRPRAAKSLAEPDTSVEEDSSSAAAESVEATAKSVQIAQPPPPPPLNSSSPEAATSAGSSTISPAAILRELQRQQQELTRSPQTPTASKTSPPPTSPTAPPITSTTKRPVVQQAARTTEKPSEDSLNESKWLVRLRRFGSNEVDIVKVVVSNLAESARQWTPPTDDNQPQLRYISFKDLEPSNAYEICVESASPNQQVADKFQLLDANHFLKCHDTSQVELSNMTAAAAYSAEAEGDFIRRMDLTKQPTSPADSGESERLPVAQPRTRFKLESASSEQPRFRVKSLCKEFFTLPAGSADKVSFNSLAGSPEAASSSGQPPVPAAGQPRKPKSLSSALKSRMELLEISNLNGAAPAHNNLFEMIASRASQRLAATPTEHHFAREPAVPEVRSTDWRLTERPVQVGVAPAAGGDFLGQSIVPLVACIFGLVFLVTLANIILNAVSCRSPARSRSRRRMMEHRSGLIGGRSDGGAKRTPGSFYSDSDHSGTSHSRIVVIGKSGESFATSSAYFEVPMDPVPRDPLSLEAGGSSGSSSGQRSSSHLLASSARFPLGPSFEGDEKHNADMVGLARKNYDEFINQIYNSGGPEAGDSNLRPLANRCSDKGNLRRHQRHHLHRHHRSLHGHSPRQQRRFESGSQAPETQRSADAVEKSSRGKLRIRFDKINPIYNMDNLYTTGTAKSRHRKSAVSTFGHTNAALIAEEDELHNDDNRSMDSSTGSDCQYCCQEPPSCSGEGCVEVMVDNQSCQVGEAHSGYFSCCLDKQKQRFQEQQQQLELVVTKNGSLLPQPFINPSGPSRCASSDCQMAREHSHEGEHNPDESSKISAVGKSAQLGGNEQDAGNKVTEEQAESKQKGRFMYGDTPPGIQETALNSTSSLPATKKPPLPPPSPPSSAATLGVAGKAPLVNMSHLGGTAGDAEIINKSDFNLRRSELASKLHLAGMSKPS